MKKRTLLWLILALVIFGGGAWMAMRNKSIWRSNSEPTSQAVGFNLKEHEEDMADFVKVFKSLRS